MLSTTRRFMQLLRLPKYNCSCGLSSARDDLVVRFRCMSSGATKVAQGQEKVGIWDLYAGVVLERKPIITQDMTNIEKEYGAMLAKVEFELSKKSDHEVRKQKDKIMIDKIKSGELDADQAAAITAQDEEDLWSAELSRFKPADRKTVADKSNDQKSLNRSLDSHLLLVVEQKFGQDYKWSVPHGKLTKGENMRQAAERTLQEICPDIKAKVLGNAPWGFYKYKYPKNAIIGQGLPSIGAKIFFYKAQVISEGAVKDNSSNGVQYKNYLWLTRDELMSKLQLEYHKHLCECLIDETN